MMMDTALQQQTDSNGQSVVTQHERQALIQKLQSKWPLELSTRIENQAYEKSRGIKNTYVKFVQMYFQQVQTALQNRAGQQPQQQPVPVNNPMAFQNIPQSQPSSAPLITPVQMPRFPVAQQASRMTNPQGNSLNPMTRLREPQKFNPTPMNTISYTPSPPTITTTVDLSQGYSSQQITHPNDYASLQPRYPIQPSMNVPRARAPMPTTNYPQTTLNNSNDIVHQLIAGNSSSPSATIVNTNNPSSGDQLLQRILLSNIDAGVNKIQVPNRTAPIMSQPTRPSIGTNSNLNNSTNPLRLPPSPSVMIIPTPTQTSTVQIQPSNNITIQQSPLSNSNGPYSVGSQSIPTNSSTPGFSNHSSPINRTLPLSGIGNISSPDDETINLIKYLRENINRLQLLSQKFTNEGNHEKLRQVQSIHHQIVQFVNNPTYETLANAKHFRDMLERIPSRIQAQPSAAPSTTTNSQSNVFNQCVKVTNDFLLRDQKERINVTKRYLEPLTDVINGVPHKMMRLDVDSNPPVKIHSSNQTSLLSKLNDEMNQLPNDIFSIECTAISRTRKNTEYDGDYWNKNGFILRCKLREKSNPIIPTLRLYVTTSYPEQAPEVLSLTKSMPPRLEFTDGHPFFDQISSRFISQLFKLRSQHTITEILNIWRQSVQTAL